MKYSFYEIGESQTTAAGTIFLQSNLELRNLSMHKYTLVRKAVISKEATSDTMIMVLTGIAEISINGESQQARAQDIFPLKSGVRWIIKNTGDQNFSFFVVESH